MGYTTALVKAGATLHAETHSGDWQGTWYAIITYRGMLGVCSGSYGSCGGCDAFQSWRDNFGWDHEITDAEYAAFARDYLDNIDTFEKVKASLESRVEDGWDSQSAEETLAWLIEEWKKVSTDTVVAHFMEDGDDEVYQVTGQQLREAVQRLIETGRLTEPEPEPEVMIEVRVTYPSGEVTTGYVHRYEEDEIVARLHSAEDLNATGNPWKPPTPTEETNGFLLEAEAAKKGHAF
jgi:hypothetical protein